MKNLTDFRKTVETGVDPRLDTKIGEVTSFLVNKLPSVRIEAIPHIPSRELDYYLWWCIFLKSWQWVRGQYILLLHLYADSSPNRHYKLITRVTLTRRVARNFKAVSP